MAPPGSPGSSPQSEPGPGLLERLLDLEKKPAARSYTPAEYNLDAFRAWLGRLDNPQDAIPVIHVAGTKGKGSTCALIEAMLRAQGLRTALYTSPHLEHFGQRFRFDGIPWSLAQFNDAVRNFEPLVGMEHQGSLGAPGAFRTLFEVLTGLMFTESARRRVDVLVLETGLGGRLDATNVVRPEVAVITAIGFDHTALLGNTIEAIASEKAGIIKPGRPVVLGPQPVPCQRSVHGVVARRAVGVGATLHDAAEIVSITGSSDHFPRTRVDLNCPAGDFQVWLSLQGAHQVSNLRTAVAAVLLFLQRRGINPALPALAAGARGVDWPGRFQIFPGRPVVILDGAHCPLSAGALGATLGDLEPHLPGTIRLAWGMQADKDHHGFLSALTQHLGPRLQHVHAYEVPGGRGAAAAHLVTVAAGLGIPASVAASPLEALQAARNALPGVALCAGTLYTLGLFTRTLSGQSTT